MYGIPFPIMRGNLPEAWILSAIRGDQRKRLMGTAFPLADPSISGQVPGSRITGHLRTKTHFSGKRVYQDLRITSENAAIRPGLLLTGSAKH
jgi:hypothetical protein